MLLAKTDLDVYKSREFSWRQIKLVKWIVYGHNTEQYDTYYPSRLSFRNWGSNGEAIVCKHTSTRGVWGHAPPGIVLVQTLYKIEKAIGLLKSVRILFLGQQR